MTQPPDTTTSEPAAATSEPSATRGVFGRDSDGHDRWARALDAESARIARRGHRASVVLIDLDGAATDDGLWGSDDADLVLSRLAETIRRNTREADVVVPLGAGRYGILLVDTDQVLAINFVERVRHACDAWLSARKVGVRLVIGWADARPGRSIHEALADAEHALERDRRAIWAS